jgi:peptidoglycan hydrolase FlgJ
MAALHAFTSASATTALDALAAYGARSAAASSAKPASTPQAKAHAAAVKFEAQFLNTMFNEMFTDMDGDGPFGGSTGVGVWRSFLTEQYANSFAKAGGIGIADHVYRALMAQQESGSAQAAAPAAGAP